MPNSREFADYVANRLGALGGVAARRMFGGHGIFLDGLMFGLIANDTLYLKVDGQSRDRYLAEGLEPFKPFEDRPTTMAYFPVPDDVFEDDEALCEWAREAFAAALRARRSKGSRKSEPSTR